MTTLERDIKIFIVKALARYQQPMTEESLRAAIASAFQHVALTAGDVGEQISACETDGLIAGINDDLLGLIWTVTPKGKIRAQSIR